MVLRLLVLVLLALPFAGLEAKDKDVLEDIVKLKLHVYPGYMGAGRRMPMAAGAMPNPKRQIAVYLNGVRIDDGSNGTLNANPAAFMKNGKNTLRIDWTKITETRDALRVSLKVLNLKAEKWVEIKPGVFTNQRVPGGTSETVVDHSGNDDKVDAPNSKTFEFEVKSPYGWEWESTPAVGELSKKDLKSLNAEVRKFHGVFAAGKGPQLKKALGVILVNKAMVDGSSVEMVRDHLDGDMVHLTVGGGWKALKFDESKLTITAGGHLVRVDGFGSQFEIERNGDRIPRTLYYMKVKKKWKLFWFDTE